MTKEFKKLLIIILILILNISNISPVLTLVYSQDATPSATLAPLTTTPPVIPTASIAPAVSVTPVPVTPTLTSAQPSSAPQPTPTSQPLPTPMVQKVSVTPSLTPIPGLSFPTVPAQESALLRQKLHLAPLEKNMFQSKEKVRARLRNDYGKPYRITVRDMAGREIPVYVEKNQDGADLELSISPYSYNSFRPGKFKLQIMDENGEIQNQEFTWGVLAVNTNKSIYTPNEKAVISMAVLDDMGAMVCDAKVQLDITSPDGEKTTFGTWDRTIQLTQACQTRELTYIPDYVATYDIKNTTGKYQLNMTAQTRNGTRTVSDSFEVKNSVPFDVERITATRIFPINIYDVRLKVKANFDFTGKITETVPGSFKISHPPNSPSKGYDSIAAKTANLGKGQVFGIYSAPNSLPFNDSFPITQSYNEVPSNLFLKLRYWQFGLPAHDGIDYAMPEGTPIHAIDKAKVLVAGWDDYGITVILQHDWGKSFYGHLSNTDLEAGQVISAGSQIGLSGNTGLSTGPHLHFAIEPNDPDRNNGLKGKVNPDMFLKDLIIKTETSKERQYQELEWNLSIKKGDEITLGYSYDAPEVSPQLHLLGPLTFSAKTDNTFPAIETVIPLSVSDSTSSASIVQSESTSSSQIKVSGSLSESGLPQGLDLNFKSDLVLQSDTRQSAYGTVFEEARRWQIAVDADVTITNNPADQAIRQSQNPALVFTSDQVGYMFFINKDTDLVYSKTTNGGTTWGSQNPLSDTNNNVFIQSTWYDQWTPGLVTGTGIHIAFGVPTNDDQVNYIKLDTSTDTKTGPYLVDNLANFIGDEDAVAITRSTDDYLYIGISDGSNNNATIKKCALSSSCDADTDWSDTSDNLDNANDYIRLMPLAGGQIMLIRQSLGANDIECDLYNGTSWAGITDIFNNTLENNLYQRPWGLVSRRYNGNMYLVYVQNPGTNDTSEVHSWFWSRDATPSCSDWVQRTDVIPNTDIDSNNSVIATDIALDEEGGNIFASYIRGAAGSATNLYYKKSTDNMSTWTSESQLNTSFANNAIIYSWLNMANSERIYFAYHEDTSNSIMGGTVVNLTPPTLDEIMKHGEWWSKIGVRKTMSF